MALGTLTIGAIVPLNEAEHLVKCSFAGDDAYPAGGTLKADVEATLETAIAAAVAAATDKNVRGLSNPTIVEVIRGDCGQYIPTWDSAVGLKVLDGGDAARAEVAPGDLSGTTFNVTFVCH